MKIIEYKDFWNLIDKLDIYFKNNLSRGKYSSLFIDKKHFEKIRSEYNKNNIVGLKLVAFYYYLSKYNRVGIYMNTNDLTIINIDTHIYTLIKFAKHKYIKKRFKMAKYIEYDEISDL